MARTASGKTAAVWQDRFERWDRSGLSVRQFCAREGVSEPSFYVWRKRLQFTQPAVKSLGARGSGNVHRRRHDGMSTGTAKPVAIGPRFVPVEVVDAFCSATPSAASGTYANGAASRHVDVLLPGGVTVRVEGQVDEAVLRSIFRAIVAEMHKC